MERILVLGGDGFIGSNLVRSLVKDEEYHIRVFDLFKNNTSVNLKDVENHVEFFSGNFLNRDDLKKVLVECDYVFHFISMTTPGSSANDPFVDVDANIKTSIALFEECVSANVKKVIFASSGGAIYGDQEGVEYFSEQSLPKPISPYAISKLTIEHFLRFYKVHRNLDYIVLRYSNPYGHGQNVSGGQGIIPIFLDALKNDRPITIFGNGENIRDYIHVDDLVENTKRIFKKDTKNTLYNIGSGYGASINEVVSLIERHSGKQFSINHLPSRDIDVRRVVLDIERIKGEIDYHITQSLSDGIKGLLS